MYLQPSKVISCNVTKIMFPIDEKQIQFILSKLKQTAPEIHTKIFGSDGNNIRKRQATLISHCKEALRVLNSKRINFGKNENATIRAALVIDYLVRNVRNDSNSKMYVRSSIPIKVLIDMLKLKKIKKDLVQMQEVLGAYLAETAIATKINSNKSSEEQTTRTLRKRNADGTAISSNAAAPTENKVSQTGLIRDLCINLGPLIPDAEFVFKYATKLFDALSNNVSNKKSKNSNSQQRREQDSLRQDMARCLDCYEGACFYLAVKESEGANYNDVLKKKASAKLSLKNQQKKEEGKKKNWDGRGRKEDGPKNNNNGEQDEDDQDNDEDDTDDDRPMNETDVVMAACLSESTFTTVLAYVKKYAQDFVISLDDSTDQKQPAKKQRNVAMKDTMTGQRFGGQSAIFEGDIRRPPKKNAQFEKWKQNVLNAAITKRQEESGDKLMSRKDAMKCAADEVIRELQKSS